MGTDFKSVMPRDERGRWVRLPRTPAKNFRNEISRFQPIRKPPTITIRGLFLSAMYNPWTKGAWKVFTTNLRSILPPRHPPVRPHAGYDMRVQVESATHLGPLPLFGNRQICRILFPTLLSPRNNASTPHLDCPQSNATSREPCRLQQLHSGCLN